MKRNVGRSDRLMRGAVAVALLVGAAVAPLPLPAPLQIAAFGGVGLYLALTALAGRCVGYSLLGRSSCPLQPGGRGGHT